MVFRLCSAPSAPPVPPFLNLCAIDPFPLRCRRTARRNGYRACDEVDVPANSLTGFSFPRIHDQENIPSNRFPYQHPHRLPSRRTARRNGYVPEGDGPSDSLAGSSFPISPRPEQYPKQSFSASASMISSMPINSALEWL